MAPGYKADEYVTNNGPRGNGYSYERDEKTGKWGVRYGTGPGSTFVPDPDEKQPGYRPPQEEPSAEAAGPSDYDRMVDGVTDEFGRAFGDAAKMTGKTVKGVIAFLIGLAAANTFAGEMAKDPNDVGGAAAKTGRTIACGVGIVIDIIAMMIGTVIVGSMENPTAKVVGDIVLMIGAYTVWGLVRVARGKRFLVNPIAGFRKIRTIKVPKIAYVGIELLVTALMTKPVLNWINSFTIEWARENQDTVSDGLVIALGIGMLAVSIIIAAIVGLIVCKLIKAITAK